MKISLDGLDGRNFTLRLPRDGGGEHVIALHDAKGLRGAYEHDEGRFSLAPIAADAIVGTISWALEAGSVELGGPMSLGATRIALEIRRDDAKPAVTGELRCDALSAPSLGVLRAGMSFTAAVSVTALDARHDRPRDAWEVTCESFSARDVALPLTALSLSVATLGGDSVRARHGDGATDAMLGTLTLTKLVVAREAVTVDVGRATVQGLRVQREADGALRVAAESVELAEVSLTQGAMRATAPTLTLRALRYSDEGVSFGALSAAELAVSVEGLGAPAARAAEAAPVVEAQVEATRALGLDLPFLDHLEGNLEADTLVDVKVPWIERRVATHRLRLPIVEGRVDFKQLERGLSRLEDAILDFEVDDQGLYFEVDAVVWKRTLLRWPLGGDELQQARQGRVRLRTLAHPTLTAPPAAKAEAPRAADSRFALRRVAVDGLRIDLSVKGQSTLPLGDGTLRLGDDETPALGSLSLHGSLALDASKPEQQTTLSVALDALCLGVDGVAAGARRFDLRRARVGSVGDGAVTLRGFTPTAASATLRDVVVEGFTLTQGS